MSETLSPAPKESKAAARRKLADSLVRDWEQLQTVASPDHDEGRHVGEDDMEVACGACMYSGDRLRRPDRSRGEYLERNIAEKVALMRLRADFSSFEFARPNHN